MNKHTGSIILILLIIITLTSITSVAVLQSVSSLKKQNNALILHQKSNEITKTESAIEALNITNGVDFSLLPISETNDHQIENHQFKSSREISTNPISYSPLNGYSLNSIYKTKLVKLETDTSSQMVKSSKIINGFGCLLLENAVLSKDIESTYSLDFDQDSINNVSYQFDSVDGDILRFDASAQLLANLTLATDQSFSRPQFSIFNFGESSNLALAFIVQNSDPTTPNTDNLFYLLFDKALFGLPVDLPINPDELIDINTNPVFSADKGYFLELDQGQLISSAITIFNQKVIFVTQSPVTDPVTGLSQYINKLVKIDFDNGSNIDSDIQMIATSANLLNLKLTTHNHLDITLSSQYGPLSNFSSECRSLYQYEN